MKGYGLTVLSDRSRKKTLFFLLFPLFLALSLLIAGQFLFPDRFSFDRYTDQYCRQLLSQDTLSLHYALADPAACGMDSDTVTLGSFPSGDAGEARAAAENQSAVLSSFDPDHLSAEQRLTLAILTWQNTLEKKLLENYALWDQPSSGLGIQAQLPILFAEYTFREREDIDTYFLLLADTDRYLKEYLSFLQEKIPKGLAPSTETLDALAEQCREFLGDQSREHFLQKAFASRCRECDFLSDKDRATLLDEHFSLLTDHVFRGYEELIAGFEEMYSQAEPSSRGLATYPGGREYYEAYVQYICGTELSLEDIRLRLYAQFLTDIEAAKTLDLSSLDGDSPYEQMDASAMLTNLQGKITSCFPAGPDTVWTVREVEPELAEYSSPAFYMVPPVDDLTENTIYVNPRENLSGFSLYTTLAHEGFPGHLYQNTYYYSQNPSLIRRLLSFGGYTEGWATYTESLICELDKKQWDGARVYWLDRSLNLCMASLLDIGIHGDGWDREKTCRFLADFGITDRTAAEDLYQYIVENPGNYLRYYLGCLSFLDLRSECRRDLGESFALTAFHKAVLDCGPCPFSLLRTEVRNRLGLPDQTDAA